MAARGPKSAAALSVVATAEFDSRPKPPKDLTARQSEIWRQVVASEPSEQFRTAALQLILTEFCRHTETAETLAGMIYSFEPEWLLDEAGFARYRDLLAMRDRETKALADKATKLRLTNQSRYTPQAAATAIKHAGPAAKPWERHA